MRYWDAQTVPKGRKQKPIFAVHGSGKDRRKKKLER